MYIVKLKGKIWNNFPVLLELQLYSSLKAIDISFAKRAIYYVGNYVKSFINRKKARKQIKKYWDVNVLQYKKCFLCGSERTIYLGSKNGFSIVRCENCGINFTQFCFPENIRRKFTDNYFGKSESILKEYMAKKIFNFIDHYCKQGNFYAIGDISSNLTNLAKEKGFNTNENYRNFRKYDVIISCKQIQSSENPLNDLQYLCRILKEGGILSIIMPNFGLRELLNKGLNNRSIVPWKDVYFFDFTSFKKILDSTNLKIMDIKIINDIFLRDGLLVVNVTKRYQKVKRKGGIKILVMRDAARGDVLLTTPVLRALKKKYENCKITFFTKYPEILRHNPYIDELISKPVSKKFDLTIDLRYELYPEKNRLEAYFNNARLEPNSRNLEFLISENEKEFAANFYNESKISLDDFIVCIHTAVAPRTRFWQQHKYQAVADYLRNKYKAKILTVGGSDCQPLNECVNTIKRMDLRKSVAVLSYSKLLICPDSFFLHAACALDIPTIALFASTLPEKVLANIDKNNIKIVQSNVPCKGCRHLWPPEISAGCRHLDGSSFGISRRCKIGRPICMESISSKTVIEAIEEFIHTSA